MSAAVEFRPFTGADGFVEVGVLCPLSGEIIGLISRPCKGAKWLVYGKAGVRPLARTRTRKAAEAFFLEAGT